MTFREFEHWYFERTNDKKWTKTEALRCTCVIIAVMSHPEWERNQIWKQMFEADLYNDVIKSVNDNIKADNSRKEVINDFNRI